MAEAARQLAGVIVAAFSAELELELESTSGESGRMKNK